MLALDPAITQRVEGVLFPGSSINEDTRAILPHQAPGARGPCLSPASDIRYSFKAGFTPWSHMPRNSAHTEHIRRKEHNADRSKLATLPLEQWFILSGGQRGAGGMNV